MAVKGEVWKSRRQHLDFPTKADLQICVSWQRRSEWKSVKSSDQVLTRFPNFCTCHPRCFFFSTLWNKVVITVEERFVQMCVFTWKKKSTDCRTGAGLVLSSSAASLLGTIPWILYPVYKGSARVCSEKAYFPQIAFFLCDKWCGDTISWIHQKHQPKNLCCFWSLIITVSALQEDWRSKQSESERASVCMCVSLCLSVYVSVSVCMFVDCNFQLLRDCWNKKFILTSRHCWVWNMSWNWQRELKSVNATFSDA